MSGGKSISPIGGSWRTDNYRPMTIQRFLEFIRPKCQDAECIMYVYIGILFSSIIFIVEMDQFVNSQLHEVACIVCDEI